MREDGAVKVEGEAAEEDYEEGEPFEVLHQGSEEALFSEAVAEHS